MLYRAEIIAGNQVLIARNYPDTDKRTRVTHPQQAMRRIVDSAEREGIRLEFFTVYVVNEQGQVWKYNLRKKGSRYEAEQTRKSTHLLTREARMDVFSGNMSIAEVI